MLRWAVTRRCKAARDRFYKGDIARTMAKFSEENGGLFRYEDFASYTGQVRGAGFHRLSRLSGIQERFGHAGTGGAVRAEYPGRLRPEGHGPQQPGVSAYQRRGGQAGHGRPREIPGRHGFHQDSIRGTAVEAIMPRERRKLIDPNKASYELRPGNRREIQRGLSQFSSPAKMGLSP